MDDIKKIDRRLLAIAQVKLEEHPEALRELIDTFQANNDRGAGLREWYRDLRAKHAADFLSSDHDLSDDIIRFMEVWREVHQLSRESEQSDEKLMADNPAIESEIPTSEQERQNSPANVLEAVQRFPAQDAAIDAALRALGYDPLNIPPHKPGGNGIKSEVREYLNSNALFTNESFNHAWKRAKKREREAR